MNRAFKVIQGHPDWCRQKSRMVCCRNVQLMPTLFLKRTKKMWQRENGKFVDFNDPTQVWRRPSKKRLRISTNDLYRQKLELLTYVIFVADSMGLHSLVFTLKVEPSQSRTASTVRKNRRSLRSGHSAPSFSFSSFFPLNSPLYRT